MTAPTQTRVTSRHFVSERRSVRTRELFLWAQRCESEQERRSLMDAVVEMHLGFAHSQAARYRSRGVPLEDLQQVAAMALTRATRGYDVTSGHDFMSYAVPTIRGDLRKSGSATRRPSSPISTGDTRYLPNSPSACGCPPSPSLKR
jgi:DNA-directed RNA polymerase sigma subunit (sigma70/sigma32)